MKASLILDEVQLSNLHEGKSKTGSTIFYVDIVWLGGKIQLRIDKSKFEIDCETGLLKHLSTQKILELNTFCSVICEVNANSVTAFKREQIAFLPQTLIAPFISSSQSSVPSSLRPSFKDTPTQQDVKGK